MLEEVEEEARAMVNIQTCHWEEKETRGGLLASPELILKLYTSGIIQYVFFHICVLLTAIHPFVEISYLILIAL